MGTAAPRTSYRVTFAVLATGVMAYALLQSLVMPVLPTLQAELHTTQNTVTWVLTGYLLSASVCTPIIGRFGDMWGKERMMVVALVALGVGCVLSAVAGSIGVMIVGRVIQGAGGGVLPLAFGIVRDEFPAERVAGAVGVLAALTAVGSGLGIVLAGPVVSALSSHWLFWIPTLMIALAAVATHYVIPESPVRMPGKVSWTAVVLLSGWLVALLLPISEAPAWGWGSPRVVGLLVAAAVLAGLWILAESRSAQPLIDMRMMRIPVVWTANLVAFLMGVGMYASMAFIPQFLQTPASAGYGFGATITRSGLLLLPSCVVMFGFGVFSGRLTHRFGSKRVLVTGTAVGVVSFAMLLGAHSAQWEIVVAEAVLGASFGLGFAAMSSLVVEGVPADQTGVASGMNANIRTIGGSVGAAIMSSVIAATVHDRLYPTAAGYDRGFLLLMLATAAAAAAALLVPNRRRPVSLAEFEAALPHAELGLLAAGTLVGDESE